MPTIYDLLPTLKQKICNLLATFMTADNGALYTWEIAIFLPAANTYLHYLDGINTALKNDNYISAMANLRGLIESLGAIVYDRTTKLPHEAYDKFLKTGRLPKWDEEKKTWRTLRPRESVIFAQLMVNSKINLKIIYDHCCDMLHFSAKHMAFLSGFQPQVENERRSVQFKIGIKDNIPVEKQQEIIDLCIELTIKLEQCITAGIQEKNRRHTPKK